MEFPSASLGSATATLSNVLYGAGTYTISASAEGTPDRQHYKAFDNDNMTVWQMSVDDAAGVNHWLQLKLPHPIRLQSYLIDATGGNTIASRCPTGWRLDGYDPVAKTWVVLHNGTKFDYTGPTILPHVVNSQTLVDTLKFTITDVSLAVPTSVPELKFYGTW